MHICIYAGKKQLIFCLGLIYLFAPKSANQCTQQSAWVIFSNSNVLFVLRQHTKRTWFFDCCDSIFYTIKVTFDLQQVNTSSAEGPHLPIGGDLALS